MKQTAIKALLFVMMPVIANAEQSVYIDQAGENFTLTLQQYGGDGNSVGDATSVTPYFEFDGDNMTLSWDFNGASNKVTGFLSGDSLTFDLGVEGDNNDMLLNGTLIDNSTYDINIVGSSNTWELYLGQVTSASYSSLTYGLDGDDNEFTITIDADGIAHDVAINGDYNNLSYFADGYGSSLDGHVFNLDLTGSSNTYNITQETTAAAGNLDIVSVGSNQTINITQSD